MSNLLAYFKPKPFDFAGIFGNVISEWYYYLIGLVCVGAVIFAVLFLLKKHKRNNLNQTQRLVYTAVFSALAFVANYFTIPISQAFQVSLVAFVGFVCGFVLGGGLGFSAMFIGDLICAIIKPTGVYSPIINVGTALWGFIPGVIFTVFKGNDFIKAIISFVLCFIFNSFLVNTYGISVMYGISFSKLLYALPIKLAVVVINASISMPTILLLKKVLPKDKFCFVDKVSKVQPQDDNKN